METIANVEPVVVCARVMQIFFGSFIYIYLIAKLVGPDNKLAWFRKRKKYTFFNRRGIFGEDINFGYHSAPNDSDSQSDNEPSENNLPEQLLWQTPVSFQLKSGDRLRIEGTNGSGKTTLLKIITGQLQEHSHGQIFLMFI